MLSCLLASIFLAPGLVEVGTRKVQILLCLVCVAENAIIIYDYASKVQHWRTWTDSGIIGIIVPIFYF